MMKKADDDDVSASSSASAEASVGDDGSATRDGRSHQSQEQEVEECQKSAAGGEKDEYDEQEQDSGGEEEEDASQQPEELLGTTDNTDTTSYQKRWAEMYQRLVAFKEKHGHCRVPNRYEQDTQLGYWVSTQRRQHRLLTTSGGDAVPLSLERAKKLEDIGFEWSAVPPSHKSWDGRYAELCDFVSKKGHAQVPMGYEENPRLATWVSTQRQEYKLLKQGRSSRLTEAKKKKLDDVGFVWEAQRGRRKSKRGSAKKKPDSQDEEEAETQAAKQPPRASLKEPPMKTLKETPKSVPKEQSSNIISQSSLAQLPTIRDRSMQATSATKTATVAAPLQQVRSLSSQSGDRFPGSSLATTSTLPLNPNTGPPPTTAVLRQAIGSTAITPNLSVAGQRQGLATASMTAPSLPAATSALLQEQNILWQLARGGASTAQAQQQLALTRHRVLFEQSLPAGHIGADFSSIYGTALPTQRSTHDQQQLLNQSLRQQQLLLQEQQQLRQLQQLEALRNLRALSAPTSQLSQSLGLGFPSSSSSLLLPTASSNMANNPLSSSASLMRFPSRERLPVQDLAVQQDASLQELHQAQLRATLQLESSMGVALGGRRHQPTTASEVLEEKSADREERRAMGTTGGGSRKRSANKPKNPRSSKKS